MRIGFESTKKDSNGMMQPVQELSERRLYLKDARSNYEQRAVEHCCRIVCWTQNIWAGMQVPLLFQRCML